MKEEKIEAVRLGGGVERDAREKKDHLRDAFEENTRVRQAVLLHSCVQSQLPQLERPAGTLDMRRGVYEHCGGHRLTRSRGLGWGVLDQANCWSEGRRVKRPGAAGECF